LFNISNDIQATRGEAKKIPGGYEHQTIAPYFSRILWVPYFCS